MSINQGCHWYQSTACCHCFVSTPYFFHFFHLRRVQGNGYIRAVLLFVNSPPHTQNIKSQYRYSQSSSLLTVVNNRFIILL